MPSGKVHRRGGTQSVEFLTICSNNIGQIAYLQAQNHNLEHIYFGGSFIRGILGSEDPGGVSVDPTNALI